MLFVMVTPPAGQRSECRTQLREVLDTDKTIKVKSAHFHFLAPQPQSLEPEGQ